MYKIQSSLDVFHPLIEKFVAASFPQPYITNNRLLLDLVSDEIFGTKMTRLGPKPSPEIQVAIRDTIRFWIEKGQPIPFMVPWGSKKPNGGIIDIAELSAMKVLEGLHHRVREHYMPSVQFVIRSEDVAAAWLYNERADEARAEAKLYSDGLEKLPQVLEMDFIQVMRESKMTDEVTFIDQANSIMPYMQKYLLDRDEPTLTYLKQQGWAGAIPQETIQYYLHLYEKLYPQKSVQQRVEVLARYFSGALARKRLGLRGNKPEWGTNFLDLAFMAPIPGTEGYFAKRVHYRALPTVYSSNHMIPWRSKGVLKISNDNEVTPNLCSFNDLDGVNTNQIVLTNGNLSVAIQADYKLV